MIVRFPPAVLPIAMALLSLPVAAQWVQFEDQTASRISASPALVTADPEEKSYAWGDLDRDGDIDQSDFGRFQACLSGPGIAQPNPACTATDLDGDTDVDADDLAAIRACMGGANVPANADCGG